MDLGLGGLNAVVTGGTKGIGRAIADTLADEGANVAICARHAADVESAVAALQAKGVRATGRALDVGDGPAAAGAGCATWRRSSAASTSWCPTSRRSPSAATRSTGSSGFEIDMMGAVRLVDAAMPSLEASAAACIVTISSVSGREIDFASGAYGAFKAALVHYTQGLAYHLAGTGIRANTVSPGNTYFEGGVWAQIETGNPELFALALGLNPTGRMGTPQEMANAVAFIASPRASFITGANLVVDGALTKGVQL